MESDDLHAQKIIQTTESYEDTTERFNCSPNRYTIHSTNTPNHFLATLTNATPFFPSTTSQPRTSPTDPERRARQVGQSLHRVAVELTVVVVVVVARPAVVVVGVASLMHRQHSSSPLPTPTPRGTVDQRDASNGRKKHHVTVDLPPTNHRLRHPRHRKLPRKHKQILG